MTKADSYRRKAAETFVLATRAIGPDKGRLLGLAERWLDLADRARGRPQMHSGGAQDPVLTAKLGNVPARAK